MSDESLVLTGSATDYHHEMFKGLLIIAIIAAAIFIGPKYQKSHPGGSNGVRVPTAPVYQPPAPPNVLGS
jgi:hypothetical protein